MREYIEIKLYKEDLQAVRLKYLQLSREIEDRKGHESHLEHSVSKLGIFINDLVRGAWKNDL